MGKKIYNFVLKKDWDFLAKKLRGPLPCLDNPNIREPLDNPDDVICEPDVEGRSRKTLILSTPWKGSSNASNG
jgi:hypothetical protein